LAKKSYDTYGMVFPNACPEEYSFAAANMIRLAVKVYLFLMKESESHEKKTKINMQWCINILCPNPNDENRYKVEDLRDFEVKIYQMPQFCMNFTTPYDYLGIFLGLWMIDAKQKMHI
jgi:hypothetical protein